MKTIKDFFSKLNQSSHERRTGRSYLKAARSGESEKYLALASRYLDFAQTYMGNTISELDSRRNARTVHIFVELWHKLRYAERLSDFEYMLAQALISSAHGVEPTPSTEMTVTKLRRLSAETRFVVIAYELANWPLKSVALAMRVKAIKLHTILSEARCELCQINWKGLTNEERACLEAISDCFDQCPNVKLNKAIQQKAKHFPRVSEIKGHWLELRAEYVETKLRYIPDQAVREQLLLEILTEIEGGSMETPALMDRMVNTIHFSRHSKIKVS